VGRRQRHSEFVGLREDELQRMLRDRQTSKAVRRKLVADLKFLKVRNRQKRSR